MAAAAPVLAAPLHDIAPDRDAAALAARLTAALDRIEAAGATARARQSALEGVVADSIAGLDALLGEPR